MGRPFPNNMLILLILRPVALQAGGEFRLGGIGGADRIVRFPRPR